MARNEVVNTNEEVPGLLNIPREILAIIIAYALEAVNEDAPAEADLQRDQRIHVRRTSRTTTLVPFLRGVHQFDVFFEAAPPVRSSLAMRLVNRQLNAEVEDYMRRHKHHLDVTFLRDGSVWPTWILVPFLKKSIDTIQVTVRVFDRPGQFALPHSMYLDSGTKKNHGDPPPTLDVFHYILESILQNGPWPAVESDEDGGTTGIVPEPGDGADGIIVKDMTIDVLPLLETDMLPEAFSSALPNDFQRPTNRAATQVRLQGLVEKYHTNDESVAAEAFAACLDWHFNNMLYHSWRLLQMGSGLDNYEKTLHEHVLGNIEIRLDGRQRPGSLSMCNASDRQS